MGAHSTIRITREKAVSMLLDALATAPDQDIGQMLDIFLYERLYNCRIIGSDEENDHDRL